MKINVKSRSAITCNIIKLKVDFRKMWQRFDPFFVLSAQISLALLSILVSSNLHKNFRSICVYVLTRLFQSTK